MVIKFYLCVDNWHEKNKITLLIGSRDIDLQ